MKQEDLEKLGLKAQELLSETPIETLKIILEFLKKKEEDYLVNARTKAEG